MFLHVPLLVGKKQLEEGKGVAIGLIKALVESRAQLGIRDPLERAVGVVDHPLGAAELPLGRETYQGWDGIS